MPYTALVSIAISLITAFLSVLGEIVILARTQITENNNTRLLTAEEIWEEVKTFGPRLCLIALGANMAIGQFYFGADPAKAQPFFWLAIISFTLWIGALLLKLFASARTWIINSIGFALIFFTVYFLIG